MILTLRTDKPEAEIGLYNDDGTQLAYHTWQAHRALAETLHRTLQDLLKQNGKSLRDITGIVVFEGPGSFTGLRIGLATANALAYALELPIIGTTGDDWIKVGTTKLAAGQGGKQALPHYGADVHTTQQKK